MLYAKAVDSLVLAVDHFNRAWDRARPEAVLILLDRSFELLLKSIIVDRRGSIREKGKTEITIGFNACLRKCLSDARVKCINEEEAITLQTINSLRDAAQHYMLSISEEQLYIYAQTAVTLFSKLSKDVLNISLKSTIPERIIPLCAKPPKALDALFEIEFQEIKNLVKPKSRKHLDAKSRLLSMAVLQASLDGRKSQPSDRDLSGYVKRIRAGDSWRDIFPSISTLTINSDENNSLSICLQITKNHGESIHLVKEGDSSASVVAVKRVNELGYYTLGLRDLSRKLGRTAPKILHLINIDRIQEDPEFFRLIKIGGTTHKRYSVKALENLKKRLDEVDLDQLWASRKN
jgi:hypothetical protein